MDVTQIALINVAIQAIVSVAMIGTFWVYWAQLRAMRDSSKGQNTLAIVSFLQSDEVRGARTIVRRDLRNKPYQDWTKEEQRAADMVCANYDVVGVLLLQEEMAPARAIIKNWGPSIRDCYEILHPHLAEMQKPERSGPEYWDDFESLYRLASNQQKAKFRHQP